MYSLICVKNSKMIGGLRWSWTGVSALESEYPKLFVIPILFYSVLFCSIPSHPISSHSIHAICNKIYALYNLIEVSPCLRFKFWNGLKNWVQKSVKMNPKLTVTLSQHGKRTGEMQPKHFKLNFKQGVYPPLTYILKYAMLRQKKNWTKRNLNLLDQHFSITISEISEIRKNFSDS